MRLNIQENKNKICGIASVENMHVWVCVEYRNG